MDEMENLRIEAELERQKSSRGNNRSGSENRDSGVADVEVCSCPCAQGSILVKNNGEERANGANINPGSTTNTGNTIQQTDATQRDAQLKRSALSNSLLDIHDQCKLLIYF